VSNYAWVCFDCRLAVRRSSLAKDVRCPGCAKPCECLGCKTPVPPKSRVRDWARLREDFYRFRRERAIKDYASRTGRLLDLERDIARLSARPAKRGRTAMIRFLKVRVGAERI
jgi:hypothetical protein